jgi:hypothetical protein
VLEFVEGCFQFLAMGGSDEDTLKPYPVVEDLVRSVQRVGMPRVPKSEDPQAEARWTTQVVSGTFFVRRSALGASRTGVLHPMFIPGI